MDDFKRALTVHSKGPGWPNCRCCRLVEPKAAGRRRARAKLSTETRKMIQEDTIQDRP